METKKANWFVRSLIIVLCIFIGGIIYFNFFWSSPQAQITSGLVVLVAFLTVLVLSEAFDNFSIAQLISLSRTVKDKENKNQDLKRENSDLRNQIVTISTSISQKQYNSTIVLSDELKRLFTVKQADEPERKQKQEEVEQENTTTTTTTTEQPQETSSRRYSFIDATKYEEIALHKFLANEGLGQFPIITDAKFTNHFQQIDPVSEYSPIFDGYIKTIDTEIFIELKLNFRNHFALRERLYLMLSKINYYRNVKRVTAYLFLVLIVRTEDKENVANFDRLLKEFEPAISNGLLRIRFIEVTSAEFQQGINEKK